MLTDEAKKLGVHSSQRKLKRPVEEVVNDISGTNRDAIVEDEELDEEEEDVDEDEEEDETPKKKKKGKKTKKSKRTK